MSRFSSSLNAAAVTKAHVPYVAFLELDFVSGTLYLSSADRPFTWGGNTYTALGKLAGIGDVTESTDITSQGLTFTVSATDQNVINTTLGENYHNRQALLSVGYLDTVTGALVDTPELIWEGLMDVLTLKADKGVATASLDCEDRLVLWNQASGWLYTQEHQRLIDPTDNFFDQVASLAAKTVVWGNSGVNTGPQSTPNPMVFPGPLGNPNQSPTLGKLPWQS